MNMYAGADQGRPDRDIDAILAGVDEDSMSSGFEIETAGFDIEVAGADYVAGADHVAGEEAAVEIVSGMVNRGVPLQRAIASLPVQLRGPVIQAYRNSQVRVQRANDIARRQPVLKDPGPTKWLETEEGFGPVTVLAGATSTDIVIQPDVLAFRPVSLFVADEVAEYFRLVYWYVGRHNALMGAGKIPCSRFKSNGNIKKWKLPTLRNGGRLLLRFENKDASDHDIEGSVAGLMIE